MNKVQEFFREHQSIRFATVLGIITTGFICAILGLSMPMQMVHGQSISDLQESELVKCTAYNSTNLVVVGTDECLALLETTDYYISQGYSIKAVENHQLFLEKIK